jgi:hypothetical protein
LPQSAGDNYYHKRHNFIQGIKKLDIIYNDINNYIGLPTGHDCNAGLFHDNRRRAARQQHIARLWSNIPED